MQALEGLDYCGIRYSQVVASGLRNPVFEIAPHTSSVRSRMDKNDLQNPLKTGSEIVAQGSKSSC